MKRARKLLAAGAAATTLALAAGSAAAQPPADPARGKTLYETYCGVCHYERLHQRSRERSIVRSLADLRDQVARWAPQTARRFEPQELEDIVAYLNASHYRFKQ